MLCLSQDDRALHDDGALGRTQGGHNALSAIGRHHRRNKARQLWLEYAYY